MGWRTVIISGRAKLDLKLNNLVIRKDEISKVHISEISILIIDSVNISITTALIEKLIEEKIKIIFCGSDHNPVGEVVNYYNKHNSAKMVRKQINWTEINKQKVWSEIIKEKIRRQSEILYYLGVDSSEMLNQYMEDIKLGDSTNREGHAAKVYFYSLFGKSFSRGADDPINAMLNFGYSILLSIFTREITSSGYITQIGIFHDNQFNYFNLASDLMEPLRPMIDNVVIEINPTEFGREEKNHLFKLFEKEYEVDGRKYTLLNAVSVYCRSIFEALEKGNINLIKLINYEL
ncbi:type II CRISPR-associated endonuclease Cas1 [Helcococcus kunzii]|uniref:CRISPR-associated endonuclease Cas1 n=1 Tax=Helcococcus kunzii ATCC 51366 TaxID=883114 RepID=H3NQF7_9FIRM|nr:type II CRISPR-associated endonuclease Cas1 [Helcococcus kunzii]EHR32287.1 CRISPR-associated endonuclease cas1, subtype II/nmeni [Helcococcus kunzii ATCC 51366]MCT1796458.1 type II CRISPR-associated endonuclease Cas1 [Helcococcus kunzii]MCT1989065.1 type II CRISPR-associated endonuclease Cas1 [Helcococcus kunzii]